MGSQANFQNLPKLMDNVLSFKAWWWQVGNMVTVASLVFLLLGKISDMYNLQEERLIWLMVSEIPASGLVAARLKYHGGKTC